MKLIIVRCCDGEMKFHGGGVHRTGQAGELKQVADRIQTGWMRPKKLG